MYVPGDLNTAQFVLFSDATFANLINLRSQLSFVPLIVDSDKDGISLQYESSRCQQVTRPFQTAETLALLYGLYNTFIIQSMLLDITGMKNTIDGQLDSEHLFNIVGRDRKTI